MNLEALFTCLNICLFLFSSLWEYDGSGKERAMKGRLVMDVLERYMGWSYMGAQRVKKLHPLPNSVICIRYRCRR